MPQERKQILVSVYERTVEMRHILEDGKGHHFRIDQYQPHRFGISGMYELMGEELRES